MGAVEARELIEWQVSHRHEPVFQAPRACIRDFYRRPLGPGECFPGSTGDPVSPVFPFCAPSIGLPAVSVRLDVAITSPRPRDLTPPGHPVRALQVVVRADTTHPRGPITLLDTEYDAWAAALLGHELAALAYRYRLRKPSPRTTAWYPLLFDTHGHPTPAPPGFDWSPIALGGHHPGRVRPLHAPDPPLTPHRRGAPRPAPRPTGVAAHRGAGRAGYQGE